MTKEQFKILTEGDVVKINGTQRIVRKGFESGPGILLLKLRQTGTASRFTVYYYGDVRGRIEKISLPRADRQKLAYHEALRQSELGT